MTTERNSIILDHRAAGYIKTLADAIATGETGPGIRSGAQVIGWLMRGWTLDAAKFHVNSESQKRSKPQ